MIVHKESDEAMLSIEARSPTDFLAGGGEMGALPIKNSHDEITGIFVQGVDVTQRALADSALRESQSRLRRMTAKRNAKGA
jgi:hypothetical protein